MTTMGASRVMTAYWDDKARRVQELMASRAIVDWYDQVDALEREVVWDVTQCAASPGLPPELRDAIHRVVHRYQMVTKPHERPVSPEADALEPPEQLHQMIEQLHDVFHAIGQRRIAGFNDSPKAPMQRRFDDEEDYREALLKAAPHGELPPPVGPKWVKGL